MIGIRTTIGPWWNRWWPNGRSVANTAGRRDDTFKLSLAELSRRASERLARRSAVEPAAAAQARRAALNAYDRARARRLRWALGFVVGVVAGTGIAALVATIDTPPAPASAGAAAPTEPAPSVDVASVAAPTDPAQETSPATAEPALAPPPVTSEGQPAVAPAPTAVTSNEAALPRDDVREIQAKLRSFGFNPGPIDGIAGRTTESAVLNYQQKRDLPQTGKVDRQVLEELRQDPAPQVSQRDAPRMVQRAERPDPRATRSPPSARRGDPLQPVKDGLDGFGRWIDSLVR